MDGFGGGGEPVGPLVLRTGLERPGRQPIARVDRGLQASVEDAKRLAELRLQGCDAVPAQHELGCVMHEFAKPLPRRERTFDLADGEHGQAHAERR
jgi:hypothetical protein